MGFVGLDSRIGFLFVFHNILPRPCFFIMNALYIFFILGILMMVGH